MNKKIKYASFITLALLALLILLPQLIPMNTYKPIILKEIERYTDRKVTIAGDISFSILPTISVNVSDIGIASIEQGTFPQLIKIENIKASLSLLQLLQGKLKVEYIDILSPSIVLEEVGQLKSWENILKANDANKPSAAEYDNMFILSNLYVKHGSLVYIKDGKKEQEIANINTSINLNAQEQSSQYGVNFDIQNHPVAFNGTASLRDGIVKIENEISMQSDKLLTKAEINLSKGSVFGELKAAPNIKNYVPDISNYIAEDLLKEASFSANFSADKNLLLMDGIRANIGAFNAIGELNYDFISGIADAEIKIANGDGKVNLSIDKDSLINIESSFKKLSDLIQDINLDAGDFTQIISKPIYAKFSLKQAADSLSVNNILVTGEDLKVAGSIKFKKDAYDYDLKTSTINAIGKIANLSIPSGLNNAALVGSASINKSKITTSSNLEIDGAIMEIKGDVDTDSKHINKLDVNIYSKDGSSVVARLLNAQSMKSLDELKFAVSLSGNYGGTLIIDIGSAQMAVAGKQTSISGEIVADFAKVIPAYKGDITISSLNLDALTGASKQRSSVGSRWSNEEIKLDFLKKMAVEFKLTINQLIINEMIFRNFKTNISTENGALNLKSLTANFYDGVINANGKVSANSDRKVYVKAVIKDVSINKIASHKQGLKMISGYADGELEINANGVSEAAIIQSMGGKAVINVKDGVVEGIDLQKLIQAINNIKNIESLLKVMEVSISGGESNFDQIHMSAAIKEGIVHLESSKLSAPNVAIEADGWLDLPRYTMEVGAQCQITNKKFPKFGIKVFGAIDNPRKKMDTSELEKYFVANVITGVIDGVSKGKTSPKDLINGIIGGINSDLNTGSNTENSKEKNESDAVNQLINQGLKNLF